jgi:hypothetical protein
MTRQKIVWVRDPIPSPGIGLLSLLLTKIKVTTRNQTAVTFPTILLMLLTLSVSTVVSFTTSTRTRTRTAAEVGGRIVLSRTTTISNIIPSNLHWPSRPGSFCTKSQPQQQQLHATTTAAYLDSLSFPTNQPDAFGFGATSRYLNSLSSNNHGHDQHDDSFSEAWDTATTTTTWLTQQQPSSSISSSPPTQWTAEIFQQATPQDLTQASLEMTTTVSSPANTIISGMESVVADATAALDAMLMVDVTNHYYYGNNNEYYYLYNNNNNDLQQQQQQQPDPSLDRLTHSLNDMVHQFINSISTSVSTASSSSEQQQQYADYANTVAGMITDTITAMSTAASHTATTIKSTNSYLLEIIESQGFRKDITGMVEIMVATLLSAPRAILDVTMMEYYNDPNALDHIWQSIRDDLWIPLSSPILLSDFSSLSPYQQAQAVLHVIQLIIAVLVAIPRTMVESCTGLTVKELQESVSQWNIPELADRVIPFCNVVITAMIGLLKVILSIVVAVVTTSTTSSSSSSFEGVGGVTGTMTISEILSTTAIFLLDDLIPAFIDGLLLIIQQIVHVLWLGGSMVMSGL